MRTSIFTASALVTACLAAADPFGAPAGDVRARATAPPVAACGSAAWPYLPPACIPQAAIRPVRVIAARTSAAETGR